MLDGHASHVCYDVIKLAIELDIVLFQLPSHTSHITQPLDVAAFGSFKKEGAKVLTAYPFKHGGTLPLKRDMAGVIGEAWRKSFSPDQNKESFAGAGLWSVDMDRAVGRLQGTGKRKPRPTDRPPLADVPIVASQKQLEEYLGERTLRRLRASEHSTQGLREKSCRSRGPWRAFPKGAYSPRKKSWRLMRRENAQTWRPRKLKRRRRRRANRREQTRRPRAWHGRRTGENGEEGGERGGEEGGEKRAGGAWGASASREGGREGGRDGRTVGDGHLGGAGGGRGAGCELLVVVERGGRGAAGEGGEEGMVSAVVEEWREQERRRWPGVSRRPPYPCQGDTGRRHL